MRSYVEIQVQSPADGSGFVAQWYAGGERSGQAFALTNIGELLFFAFFAEAPMVIPDDATRAMLCARIPRTEQRPLTGEQAATQGESSPVCTLAGPPAIVRIRAKPALLAASQAFAPPWLCGYPTP